LCSSISAHVFGVKQNVHVLVVVHGVGAPACCLRWDQFAPRRVLGACGAAIAVAWTCWPRGHDPLVLELALFNGARGFSCFDVAQFRLRGGD